MATGVLILLLFNLIVLATLQSNNEEKEFDSKFAGSAEECGKQYNVTDVAMTFSEEAAPSNKNLQCFIKCIYLKVNFLNEAGVFNVNQILKHMDPYTPAQSDKLIDKCKTVKGTDLCETAYAFSKCVGDSLRKLDSPAPILDT